MLKPQEMNTLPGVFNVQTNVHNFEFQRDYITTILGFRVNPSYFQILFVLHNVSFCFVFLCIRKNEKISFAAKQPFCIVYSHNHLDVSFLLTSLLLRCIFFFFFLLSIFVSHASSFFILYFTLHVWEKETAPSQSVTNLGNFERVDNRSVMCAARFLVEYIDPFTLAILVTFCSACMDSTKGKKNIPNGIITFTDEDTFVKLSVIENWCRTHFCDSTSLYLVN